MTELNQLRALLAEASMQLLDAAKILKESGFIITAKESEETAWRAREAATGKVKADSDRQEAYEAERLARRNSVLGRYGHLSASKPNGEA